MSRKDRGRVRRVSRDQVRTNARNSGSGRRLFNLPKGVKEWTPDKAGSVLIDVVPYKTSAKHHPDGVEAGTMWYKLPFQVHRNVGVKNDVVVCPGSMGKRCPICEKRQTLKNKDPDSEAIVTLNTQDWVAFNILDPDDKDSIAIFAMSKGKFAEALRQELDQGEDDVQLFFDVTKDGRTLKVRFSDASYEGRKYLEATRIDFRERDEMEEDEILSKTCCLEDILYILPYDRLRALFLQLDDEADDDGDKKESADDDDDDSKSKDDDKDDEDDDKDEEDDDKDEEDDDKDEEDDEDDEPPFEKGDHVKFKKGKKEIDGVIKSIDGDEAVVKSDDGEKYTVDLDDLQSADDDDNEEDDDSKSKDDDNKEDKKKKKVKPGECPHGHKFGKDTDSFPECNDCEAWEGCDDKKEKGEKESDEKEEKKSKKNKKNR